MQRLYLFQQLEQTVASKGRDATPTDCSSTRGVQLFNIQFQDDRLCAAGPQIMRQSDEKDVQKKTLLKLMAEPHLDESFEMPVEEASRCSEIAT